MGKFPTDLGATAQDTTIFGTILITDLTFMISLHLVACYNRLYRERYMKGSKDYRVSCVSFFYNPAKRRLRLLIST